MTFSYHKKYYDNNEIDLEAVEDMKFATIEQSELFQNIMLNITIAGLIF